MSAEKKYLFVCLSSIGYLYPAIRLAHILQARGQRVLFVSTSEHALVLNTQGIDHLSVKNDAVPFLYTANWFLAANAPAEGKVLDYVVATFEPDVLVGSPLALAAFVAAEKYQLPLVSIGFTEYLYPGLNALPEKSWRMHSITNYYNGYRAELGLGPIAVSPLASPLIGDCYLLRSVPELNDHLPLPTAVQYVGALYWEPSYENLPLRHFCANSQATGKPLVYLQIGRLFEGAAGWQALLGALRESPLNFLVDTGRADYIQPGVPFPDNFFVSPFIPLGAVADDVAFVICSAQSIAVTSAIVHGKPLLCLPHSADAVELTQRLVGKGLALGLYEVEGIRPEQLAHCFEQLLAQLLRPAITDYRQKFLRYSDEQVFAAVQSVFG